MRIAFDTTPLVRPYPPGVVRACRGLVRALHELDDVQLVELAPAEHVNERHWRQLCLPREIERAGVLGLHSPISAFPVLGAGRRVCTVHELPWHNGCHENAGVSHRLWARLAVGRADGALCPSEFVREQLVGDSGGGLNIHTCPWGVDGPRGNDQNERETLLHRIGLVNRPFALAVGANRPKKNFKAILHALAELPTGGGHAPVQIVVTGTITPSLLRDLQLAECLGIREQVHAVGFVDEEDLASLYSKARFSAVLSQSEGFGFPVLESYRHGTPVLVTQDSAQAEVAGKQGFAVPPQHTESLVAAIQSALQFDPLRGALLRQHAADFSWQRCANQVRDIWAVWA